jgi:hypothetical protein
MNLDTYNFFTYSDFYEFVAKKNYKTLAEVGSWKGHSITYLVKELIKNNNVDFKMYAVDLWDKWEQNKTFDIYRNDKELTSEALLSFEAFKQNLHKNDITKYVNIIKNNSHDAAKLFDDEYFDFVFLKDQVRGLIGRFFFPSPFLSFLSLRIFYCIL